VPLATGKVERREFEYIRHGICACILSWNVVTGQIVVPNCGATRTEADFLVHVQAVVASGQSMHWWHFVVDNLDIPRSASLGRYMATASKLALDLGGEGQ
jgi:hypothetical protein